MALTAASNFRLCHASEVTRRNGVERSLVWSVWTSLTATRRETTEETQSRQASVRSLPKNYRSDSSTSPFIESCCYGAEKSTKQLRDPNLPQAVARSVGNIFAGRIGANRCPINKSFQLTRRRSFGICRCCRLCRRQNVRVNHFAPVINEPKFEPWRQLDVAHAWLARKR